MAHEFDYHTVVHFLLLQLLRPAFIIVGIGGNILNIIIIKSLIQNSSSQSMKLLIALSMMDLSLLSLFFLHEILGWIKELALVSAVIFVYFSCFVKYVSHLLLLILNMLFFSKCELIRCRIYIEFRTKDSIAQGCRTVLLLRAEILALLPPKGKYWICKWNFFWKLSIVLWGISGNHCIPLKMQSIQGAVAINEM